MSLIIVENEKVFINKIKTMVGMLGKYECLDYSDYYLFDVIKYQYKIDDTNDIGKYFFIWIYYKLKEKEYDGNEISSFFNNIMPLIIEQGLKERDVIEKRERKFSYFGSIFSILLFVLAIDGIMDILNHKKDEKYNQIREDMIKELRNKIKAKSNYEKIFKIFDKYESLI